MQSEHKSYRNATLLAGSSFVNVGLAILRNKVLAIFLGPIGLGQFGILNDFINAIITVGNLGFAQGGVQAFSELRVNKPEYLRGYLKAFYLLFSLIIFICIVFLLLLSKQISNYLFQTEDYSLFIIIAAIAVGLKIFSSIQGTLLNSMQKIKMVVIGNIYQGLLATIFAITFVVWLKEKSVPYLVVSIPLSGFLVSYYYAEQIKKNDLLPGSKMPKFRSLKPYVLLGIATMWSGLLELTVAVITKSSIGKVYGANYLGFYQVSIGVIATYIGFVTAAISTDYLPELVRIYNTSKEKLNDYVNQQIRISITLLMPILIMALTTSPFIIRILYSKEFLPAVEVLDFSIIGTFFFVICVPITYVFIASRRTKFYLLSETLGNIFLISFNLIALYLGKFYFLGVSYLVNYIIYFFIVLVIFYRFYQGKVFNEIWNLVLLNSFIMTLILLSKNYFAEFEGVAIGILITVLYVILQRNAYLKLLRSLGIFKNRI